MEETHVPQDETPAEKQTSDETLFPDEIQESEQAPESEEVSDTEGASVVEQTPESDESFESEDDPELDETTEREDASEAVESLPDEVSVARRKEDRTDLILNVVVGVLVVAVLSVGGLLGLDMYNMRQAENTATPAARAIEGLKDLVRESPGSAAARVRLGEAMATAGLTSEAIEQFEAAIKLDPSHTGAYLDLGIVALETGEFNTAEGYFEIVVDLTEGSEFADVNQRREVALFYLGEITLEDGRYEDAVRWFKGALRVRRDASDTYYLLAQAYKGLGEFDAAVSQLETAMLFDPNYPEAHFLMGEILMAEGDDINAVIHFRIAYDLVPEADPPAEALASYGTVGQWIKSSQTALSEGDEETALHDAIMATVLEPSSVNAHKHHATVLEQTGEVSAALQVWMTASELAPEDPEIVDALVRLGE